MSELGIEVVPYLIGWALTVFGIASTWHLWKYCSDHYESHRQIQTKVAALSFCSGLGMLLGGFLFFFLLIIDWLIHSFSGFSPLSAIDFPHSRLVLFFASVQASTGMLLLKEEWVSALLKKEEIDD